MVHNAKLLVGKKPDSAAQGPAHVGQFGYNLLVNPELGLVDTDPFSDQRENHAVTTNIGCPSFGPRCVV